MTALDSELITARVRAAGVRLPYRLLRPLVHGWHRWSVMCAFHGDAPVVVLTDPSTAGATAVVDREEAGEPALERILDGQTA